MTRLPGALRIGLALCSLAAAPSGRVLACSPSRPAAPLIYERLTEGRQFALAAVEPPGDYRRYGYEPTGEAERILATYAKSGVYRVGESSKPILELDSQLTPEQIVAFFEEGDSAYLITSKWGDIRFYRDGFLLRELGAEAYLEWIHAPWHFLAFAPGSCAEPHLIDVHLDETGPNRAVIIKTVDGATFRYDARTGGLVGVERPVVLEAERANADEADLAKRLATGLSPFTPEKFLGLDLELLGEVWLEGCGELRQLTLQDRTAAHAVFGEGASGEPVRESRSLGLDSSRGRRLRHPYEDRVDLYRLDAGRAPAFLCGGDLSETEWRRGLADLFEEERNEGLPQDRLEEFQSQLFGSAVVAISTWDATDFDDEADRVGIATLWSRASGEWKMIMVNPFAVPRSR